MFISCWSAKGGSGTTVVAATLALLLARSEGEALLVDLAGDAPAVLGLPEPAGPGVAEWLRAVDAPVGGLAGIEVAAGSGLALAPLGAGSLRDVPVERAVLLASLLSRDRRPVVVDCGSRPSGVRGELAGAATTSLLVIRPCYLALRRAVALALRPTAVVLVDEPGRSLGRSDVEAVLGVPVSAVVALDPAVARAVDAGLLASRVPRSLARALRRAA